jgi:hypothetical protein
MFFRVFSYFHSTTTVSFHTFRDIFSTNFSWPQVLKIGQNFKVGLSQPLKIIEKHTFLVIFRYFLRVFECTRNVKMCDVGKIGSTYDENRCIFSDF